MQNPHSRWATKYINLSLFGNSSGSRTSQFQVEGPVDTVLYTTVQQAYLNFPSNFVRKLCKILQAISKLFQKNVQIFLVWEQQKTWEAEGELVSLPPCSQCCIRPFCTVPPPVWGNSKVHFFSLRRALQTRSHKGLEGTSLLLHFVWVTERLLEQGTEPGYSWPCWTTPCPTGLRRWFACLEGTKCERLRSPNFLDRIRKQFAQYRKHGIQEVRKELVIVYMWRETARTALWLLLHFICSNFPQKLLYGYWS